jgi:hypothetical protein
MVIAEAYAMDKLVVVHRSGYSNYSKGLAEEPKAGLTVGVLNEECMQSC